MATRRRRSTRLRLQHELRNQTVASSVRPSQPAPRAIRAKKSSSTSSRRRRRCRRGGSSRTLARAVRPRRDQRRLHRRPRGVQRLLGGPGRWWFLGLNEHRRRCHANRARILAVFAIAPALTGPVDATIEHGAFRVTISQHEVGRHARAPAARPRLHRAQRGETDAARRPGDYRLRAPAARNYATWQGGLVSGGCPAHAEQDVGRVSRCTAGLRFQQFRGGGFVREATPLLYCAAPLGRDFPDATSAVMVNRCRSPAVEQCALREFGLKTRSMLPSSPLVGHGSGASRSFSRRCPPPNTLSPTLETRNGMEASLAPPASPLPIALPVAVPLMSRTRGKGGSSSRANGFDWQYWFPPR